MRIICTDNKLHKDILRERYYITIGKFYNVSEPTDSQVKIMQIKGDAFITKNDFGTLTWYPKRCFTTPKQYRDKLKNSNRSQWDC